MSKPALFPDTTPSGIAVDPRTLERVIPESKRSDGTVRKEIKIRPGFTPQEDVGKFQTTKQKEMEARALPKGHIIGWVAPSSSATNNITVKPSGTMSKSQKKNEKRKEKKKADIAKKIQENWEDDDEDEIQPPSKPKATMEGTNETDPTTDEVAKELEKLEVNN